MLHIDPFAEELLHSLNERIKKGDEYMKSHPKSKKNKETLLAMRRRRRFLNSVYAYQLTIPTRLANPKDVVADITAMKFLYTEQNPNECMIYKKNESILCKNSRAINAESGCVDPQNGKATNPDPVFDLIEAYNVFDIDYDYENLEQFVLDAENLLKKTTYFVFAVLEMFSPVPPAKSQTNKNED